MGKTSKAKITNLGRAKNGCCLKFFVVFLFSRMDDHGHMAATICCKFSESSNNVVLDCKSGKSNKLHHINTCRVYCFNNAYQNK